MSSLITKKSTRGDGSDELDPTEITPDPVDIETAVDAITASNLDRLFAAKVTGDYATVQLALAAYAALTDTFLANVFIDGDVTIGANAANFRSANFHGSLKDSGNLAKISFGVNPLRFTSLGGDDRTRFVFDNLHLFASNNPHSPSTPAGPRAAISRAKSALFARPVD